MAKLTKEQANDLRNVQLLLDDAMGIVTALRDEFQADLDDLSESQRDGPKGEAIQELIDAMETAEGNIDAAMGDIAGAL